jgi:hypothetical protein
VLFSPVFTQDLDCSRHKEGARRIDISTCVWSHVQCYVTSPSRYITDLDAIRFTEPETAPIGATVCGQQVTSGEALNACSVIHAQATTAYALCHVLLKALPEYWYLESPRSVVPNKRQN